MGVRGAGSAAQVGQILDGAEALLLEHRPDRLLILGDTNSGLPAIVARRLGIPVYHMEAGNRCYDDRVPEEVNRRVIDHCSTVLMPYTQRSRENLLREGIDGPADLRDRQSDRAGARRPRSEDRGEHDPRDARRSGEQAFFLVTMHRAENVDVEDAAA